MIATTSLGSFVVNLGRLERIPQGEGRVFRVGGRPIAVFHTRDANVFATEATCPVHGLVLDLNDGRAMRHDCKALKTFPTMVNEEGNILVGIEQLLAAAAR